MSLRALTSEQVEERNAEMVRKVATMLADPSAGAQYYNAVAAIVSLWMQNEARS